MKFPKYIIEGLKQPRLPAKPALWLCWKLWDWLSKHPDAWKDRWPGNSLIWELRGCRILPYHCPCCDAAMDWNTNCRDCRKCLLKSLWGRGNIIPCDINQKSPYRLWRESMDLEVRRKAARAIATEAQRRWRKLK